MGFYIDCPGNKMEEFWIDKQLMNSMKFDCQSLIYKDAAMTVWTNVCLLNACTHTHVWPALVC